jgi:hypothetical protein
MYEEEMQLVLRCEQCNKPFDKRKLYSLSRNELVVYTNTTVLQCPPSRGMDTTAGLENLAVLPGLDLVFLVQRERRAAIIGFPNAQGVQPMP